MIWKQCYKKEKQILQAILIFFPAHPYRHSTAALSVWSKSLFKPGDFVMHYSFIDSGFCPLWPGAGPSFSTTGPALGAGSNDECRIRVRNVAWRRWFMCGDLRETRRAEKGQSEVCEGFFLIGIFPSLRTGQCCLERQWDTWGVSTERFQLDCGTASVASWDVLTKSECLRTCIREDTGKADLQIFLCTPSDLGRFLRTRNLFFSALCFCKAPWMNRSDDPLQLRGVI